MNELERHTAERALQSAQAYFYWQIQQWKTLWDIEAMAEKEKKLHLRKIENYEDMAIALEKLKKEVLK